MTVLQAAFLGLIQGLTEFFPVSSSGHLAIAQHFLPDFEQPGLLFDVLLHAGTMAAVVLYFRQDLLALLRSCAPGGDQTDRRVLLLLLLASVPTGIIGLAAKDVVEQLFEMMPVVGAMLLITGLLLHYAGRAQQTGRSMAQMNKWDALLVGIAQGLAVLPGISRSGATIGCLLLRGVDAEAAARFSFLLALPAIGGATLLHIKDLGHVGGAELPAYLVGTLVAFASGLLAIRLLLSVLRRRRLGSFALYCLVLGSVILLTSLLSAS
jgi:undecaprenyl-diphosphatase